MNSFDIYQIFLSYSKKILPKKLLQKILFYSKEIEKFYFFNNIKFTSILNK
jgi:hypothetical protein